MAAAELLAELVPEVDRSLLLRDELGRFADGALPPGVGVVGVELALLLRHPEFVERARAQGNEVQVWTVNDPADIAFCADLGVTGLTSDYPDRVIDVLRAA